MFYRNWRQRVRSARQAQQTINVRPARTFAAVTTVRYAHSMRCSSCQANLGPLVRADARFCSSRCRVQAHRNQPPQQLRDLARWVRFESDKRPVTTSGSAASSTNPATWSTYDEAANATAGVGVGFVLNGDGIVCVDFDNCVDGSRVAPWAADLLASCPATFTERSISGNGLHVWGTGHLERGRKFTMGDGGLEVYGKARYIAVTAKRWSTAPGTLADLSAWLPLVLGERRYA
jgi:hypothetical protein